MSLPAELRELARLAPDSAFVCDFDGTLAPIVDDPATAVPLTTSVVALQALAQHLAIVAIVSGRPVEFLRRHITVDGVALVGQYGLERLVDGRVVLDPRAAPYLDAIAAAAAEAQHRWPTLVVERKSEVACTVHWRTNPLDAPTDGELTALAAAHGLHAERGRMACELRPPLPVDKGTVYAELARDARCSVFAGDDHADLAAFAVEFKTRAPGRSVRIAVRSPEAPTELLERADLVVDGPEGFAALLADLVDAVSGRARP